MPQRTPLEARRIEQPDRDLRAVDDQMLVAWLVTDNQLEIALGDLARDRAQTRAVRNFGEQMVDDHTQSIRQLQQAADRGRDPRDRERLQRDPRDARAGHTGRDPREADFPVRRDRRRAPEEQPRETADAALIQLKQQLGRQHIETLTDEFGGKRGLEFDKAYMHSQVTAHLKMLDALELAKCAKCRGASSFENATAVRGRGFCYDCSKTLSCPRLRRCFLSIGAPPPTRSCRCQPDS